MHIGMGGRAALVDQVGLVGLEDPLLTCNPTECHQMSRNAKDTECNTARRDATRRDATRRDAIAHCNA